MIIHYYLQVRYQVNVDSAGRTEVCGDVLSRERTPDILQGRLATADVATTLWVPV